MCRLSDVQEVLRIAAPELILLCINVQPAAFVFSVPLASEALLDVLWQLSQLDGFRGKDPKEEGSLVLLLLAKSVRHDNVVHLFLVVFGVQPRSLSYFSLGKPLEAFCSFEHDVVLLHFPQAVLL